MRIVVTAMAPNLDAAYAPNFGRCPVFAFVDTDTMECEWLANPAVGAAGGAGIQAAQFVIDGRAAVVVTGSVGPNAYQVLASANVPVHTYVGETVRQAVDAFKEGSLQAVTAPTAPAHAGMGAGGRHGMGRGMGGGRGQGMA